MSKMALPTQQTITVCLAGKIDCQVIVGRLSTVRDVKVHVHCYEGVPVDQQVLMRQGQVLDNDMTMGELGVQNEEVLQLSLQLRK